MSDLDRLYEELSIYGNKDSLLYDGKKVRIIKSRITNIERYGSMYPSRNKEIKEKIKSTLYNKYGRVNGRGFGSKYSNDTMIKRYGGKTTYESEILTKKVRDTLYNRYNVDNPSKSSYIRSKMRDTLYERYGVTNISKSPYVKLKKKKHKEI